MFNKFFFKIKFFISLLLCHISILFFLQQPALAKTKNNAVLNSFSIKSKELNWFKNKNIYIFTDNVVVKDNHKRFVATTQKLIVHKNPAKKQQDMMESKSDFLLTLLEENATITCNLFQAWQWENKLICLYNVKGKSPEYTFTSNTATYYIIKDELLLQEKKNKRVKVNYFPIDSKKKKATTDSERQPKVRTLAKTAIFKNKAHILILKGNVEAFNLVSQDYFTAQYVTIFFNDDKTIKLITAKKDFKLTQNNQLAQSDTARYFPLTKKLILRGHVFIKKTDNLHLHAQSAIIYFTNSQWILQSNSNKILKMDLKELN